MKTSVEPAHESVRKLEGSTIGLCAVNREALGQVEYPLDGCAACGVRRPATRYCSILICRPRLLFHPVYLLNGAILTGSDLDS